MKSSQGIGLGRDHLFCSDDGKLRVVDIPLFIACTQHLSLRDPPDRYIYSTPVLERPWPSLEPKTDKAKANLLARMEPGVQERAAKHAAFIRTGLSKIQQSFTGQWAADRIYTAASTKEISHKRKLRESIVGDRKRYADDGVSIFKILRLNASEDAAMLSASSLQELVIHNPSVHQGATICIEDSEGQANYSMPAFGSVCQALINKQSVLAFEMALEQLYPEQTETAGAGQFDVILMDPPWDNRSVSRSEQYTTMSNRESNPLDAVADALPRLLASDSLLAIWVTNKASARRRAMEIFQDLEIHVVQEWIWVKVTMTGETVYDLDGIYRQPWEICLVGRRGILASTDNEEIPTRLIVACPDLHSRKPAIGRLLVEHYNASEPDKLRKMEIFARYVSAGWCAWGNEALKFNNEACWTQVTGTV